MNRPYISPRFNHTIQFLLVCWAAVVLLACGGGGDGGVNSTEPQLSDSTPNVFTFTAQVDVDLSTVIESEPVTINGIDVAASVSITGGEYSINGTNFTSADGAITDGQSIVVRVTSSAQHATSTELVITVGGIEALFTVTTINDTTPDVFTFIDLAGVRVATMVESNVINISGITSAVDISITDGEYSIDGGDFTNTDATVTNGQSVVVRLTSSSTNSTTSSSTLTVGDVSDIFTVTTEDDTTPDPFTFIDQIDVALNSQIESNSITVTGISAETSITISGGDYSIDGGDFTNSADMVSNGQAVVVRQFSSSTGLTNSDTTLNIGGVSDVFTITTLEPIDTIPDAFSFIDQYGVDINSQIESNPITVLGINSASTITVTGGDYSIDGADFGNAEGTVTSGQTVVVRQKSSSTSSTSSDVTLTIGGVSDTFSVNTMDIDFSLALVNLEEVPIESVSRTNPGTLQATLMIGESAAIGVPVSFDLNTGVGELDSDASSTLTDQDGVASIRLSPGSLAGSGEATATIEGSLSRSVSFTVSFPETNLTMSDPIISPTSISANGTATIEVTVTETIDGGAPTPLSETISAEFSSQCIQQGKATIDTAPNPMAGIIKAIYRDLGCGSTDVISISSTVDQTLLTQEGNVDVQPASAGNLAFVSATIKDISLQGTSDVNRSETSVITFKVTDSSGSPVQNSGVNFSLSTTAGGITLDPDTATEGSSQTDALGLVEVVVQSGTTATPVRVLATLESNPAISTASDELIISTNVANYDQLTLSATTLAPEGWINDGVESTITATAFDHYDNPVPDGTYILFLAEFGSITPSCSTNNGICSVTWTSGFPRTPTPAFRDPETITRQLGDAAIGECMKAGGEASNLNAALLPCFYLNTIAANNSTSAFLGGLGQVYGNRVTIKASVLGEESFVDSNKNGQFDQGEPFVDLTEPFTDHNDDGIFNGKLANGDPAPGASDPSIVAPELAAFDGRCYADLEEIMCYQMGGDNEEYEDFNSNQTFDLGNTLYNGSLCPQESENAGICSRELVKIWKEMTLLQAGSNANIGIIKQGLDSLDSNNYFLNTRLPATIDAHIADLHNGFMPDGTIVSFENQNGIIIGPSSCVVLNSSDYGVNRCSVSIVPDENPSSGPLIVSVETPSGTVSRSSIILTD